MARLAALFMFGVAGIAVPGALSAQEYRNEAVQHGAETGVDLDGTPLLGLRRSRDLLDDGSLAGTLIQLSDSLSIATVFEARSGDGLDAPAPDHWSRGPDPADADWLLGIEARYRPSEQVSIGLSYRALREVDTVLGAPTGSADQTLTQSLGLGLSYVFNERLSATVFYDRVRVEADNAGLSHFGGDGLGGEKLGASVALRRVFTDTDRVSVAALQPFGAATEGARPGADADPGDSAGAPDLLSLLTDPEAVPFALSFSYLDEGASIPRGLTFSLEDKDVRDLGGLNVSAMATVKVPF